LLPKNNDSARVRYVTPHRGTAKALLAEVYLSWAGYPANDILKYALAAKEAGETIDSAAYFGFELLDDFAWLWDKPHFYNSESVFSLYIPNSPTTRGSDFNVDYISSNIDALYSGFYTNDSLFLTPERNMNIVPSYFPAEVNFYNSYPTGYRKNITFYTTIYLSAPDTGSIYVDKVDPKSRIGYKKFYFDPTLEDCIFYTGSNLQYSHIIHLYLGTPRIYLFRYAQTVLTYAEAKARAGQPDVKAYECVNQIRRRANQLDLNAPSKFDLTGLSSEAFADSVVQERAWELCGETEGRWYDLVRLEKVEELATLRNKDEGGPPFGVYNKSVYFSAIPDDDIILNPQLGK
jgi:starch-binding outer membrane protein, SusD/RagB family